MLKLGSNCIPLFFFVSTFLLDFVLILQAIFLYFSVLFQITALVIKQWSLGLISSQNYGTSSFWIIKTFHYLLRRISGINQFIKNKNYSAFQIVLYFFSKWYKQTRLNLCLFLGCYSINLKKNLQIPSNIINVNAKQFWFWGKKFFLIIWSFLCNLVCSFITSGNFRNQLNHKSACSKVLTIGKIK